MADKPAPSSTIDFSNFPINGIVHHRLLLLIGRCGDRKDDFPTILARSRQNGPDGKIRVSHSAQDSGDVDVDVKAHKSSSESKGQTSSSEAKAANAKAANTGANFPDTEWEVNATYFKALIPLKVGKNTIRLTYQNLADPPGKKDDQRTIELTYQPVVDAPKLHLAIVCAKDSPALNFENAASLQSPKESRPDASPTPKQASPAATAVDSKGLGCLPTPPGSSRGHGHRPDTGSSDFSAKEKESGFSRFVHKAGQKLRHLHSPTLDEHSFAEGQQVPIVDTPPGTTRRLIQEKGLEVVRRRLAIQGYLWQAFYAEQMFRYGYGLRSINLYENPEDSVRIDRSKTGTAPDPLLELGRLPDIPLLVSDRSLKEWRDPDNAQQKPGAKNPGAPYDFSMEAVKKHIDKLHLNGGDAVAVLILDAHWEPEIKLLVAHGAVGGFNSLATGDEPNIGVMGSHWIWAAPDHLNQLTTCFMDRTLNDTRYVNIDAGEGKTRGLTVNIGSGAFLHEVGHALANPHTPYGVMLRGYQDYHRAFMTRESHSLYSGPLKPITSAQWEDGGTKMTIHPVQAIRARLHPAFKKPDDPLPLYYTADDPNVWAKMEPVWGTPAATSDVDVTCDAGIALMEFEWSGRIRSWVAWLGSTADQPNTPQKKVSVTQQFVREQVGFDPSDEQTPEVRITAVACNLRSAALESFGKPHKPQ